MESVCDGDASVKEVWPEWEGLGKESDDNRNERLDGKLQAGRSLLALQLMKH